MNKQKFLAGLEKPVFFCQIFFVFMRPFVLICGIIDILEMDTMNLNKAGSKNCPTYYIQKSIRIGNKTSTKTIERLGSIEEINLYIPLQFYSK